ncbi:MAG: 4-hydroxy-tetrahydrodipicolinate reductase, partial [Oscillospiraceae bacterium]
MIRIIIQGINGRMGKALYSLISLRDDCKVVAGIDV